MTVCRVKSKPYIKIGRSQIIQTVLVNSMGEKNNLKTKLNVVCVWYPLIFQMCAKDHAIVAL